MIAFYEKQYLVHPSYSEVGKKFNRSKSVAAKVIQEYKKQKQIMGIK